MGGWNKGMRKPNHCGHPDRPHEANGMCHACYKHSRYHPRPRFHPAGQCRCCKRNLPRVYMVYRDRSLCLRCKSVYDRERYPAERPKRIAASMATHREPIGRARNFLTWCARRGVPCTSTMEEVAALLRGRVDWRGRPLDPDEKYQLDHIHDGPAVAKIPRWMNMALTEHVTNNWDEFVAYKAYRDTFLTKP